MGELMFFEKYVKEFDPINPVRFMTPSHVKLPQPSMQSPKYITFEGKPLKIPFDSNIFPSGNTYYISFERSFTFWDEFVAQFSYALEADDENESLNTLNRNILYGLQLTVEVIKQLDKPLENYPVLTSIIKQCMNMCLKYQNYNHPPMMHLSLCVDVFTACLRQYRVQLLQKLLSSNICPIVSDITHSFPQMFKPEFVNLGAIGKLLHKAHQVGGECFVIAYLNFVRTAMQLNRERDNIRSIELPGIFLMLKFVFPHFTTWFSNNEKVIKEILYHCVVIIQEVFNFTDEQLTVEPYKSMHEFTVYNLLNENCARVLLRMLVVGSEHLQTLMENQNNWYSGEAIQFITSIQIILSILMQLVDLKKKLQVTYITHSERVEIEEAPFPFEHFIYSEEQNLKVIKATAHLMHIPFHKSIPNLACRLLIKFTYEMKTSLLAALELEPEQVRLMFLQKLRDPLESEDLKLAILKLVFICIPYQPGMTEAFFQATEYEICDDETVQQSPTKKTTNHESIGEFLVEYLMKASADDSYRSSPLFKQIFEIFHSLWMYNCEMLIKDLIQDNHFWSLLTFPLFTDICYDKKIYSQIFDILTKEIYKLRGYVDENLKSVIEKFFKTESCADTWTKYIFDTDYLTTVMDDDAKTKTYDYPVLLISWKNFVIVMSKLMPKVIMSDAFRESLIITARNSFRAQIMILSDMTSLTHCGETFLYIISAWSRVEIDKTEQSKIAVYILDRVSDVYMYLPKRSKECCLAVATKCLQQLTDKYRTVTDKSSDYIADYRRIITSLERIIKIEYNCIESNFNNQQLNLIDNNTHRSYMLAVSLIKIVICADESESVAECVKILSYSKIFQTILACAAFLSTNESTMDMAIEALEVMIAYSKLPITKNFLHFDIAVELWKHFLPPSGINQDITLNTEVCRIDFNGENLV